jgi:hypothetical protein
MCPEDDDYFDCYGSEDVEAYEALSWSQRMDMLEEMYERLGVDPKEWLKPPASFRKRAHNRAGNADAGQPAAFNSRHYSPGTPERGFRAAWLHRRGTRARHEDDRPPNLAAEAPGMSFHRA